MSSPGSDTGPRVADLGERAVIARIQSRIPPDPARLPVGIGDDAAVAVPERGALQVLTTDALIEGIHFDRRFSSAADVGYKALAVNVSDIAAMGAAPSLALLSLMLPPSLAVSALDELLTGFLEMAAEARVGLAGGNISESPGPLIVDVTVTGHVRPRRILTRGGGRPGDALFVTGAIGAAAAGLDWLRSGRDERPSDSLADCVGRHRRPEPRHRIGALLGRNRAANACMDLSDGLADAVRQVSEASGTGARIDAAALPIPPGARAWFEAAGKDPLIAAVTGGDDYELLFVASRRAAPRLRTVMQQSRGVPITRIGELTADKTLLLVNDGVTTELPAGFAHF